MLVGVHVGSGWMFSRLNGRFGLFAGNHYEERESEQWVKKGGAYHYKMLTRFMCESLRILHLCAGIKLMHNNCRTWLPFKLPRLSVVC